MNDVKRIALIGPESSGKTSLCAQLAEYFQTVWVPEFARDYIAGLKRKYTVEDIEHCYKEQLKQENELLKTANRYLFVDTELIVAKVWSEDVFKKTPQWVEKNIAPAKYDLYLLTYNDLPWQPDPVRENPNRREFFFEWYKCELESRQLPFSIINGDGKERLLNAVKVIETH